MATVFRLLLSFCFLLKFHFIQAHESFTRYETLSDNYTLEWTVNREDEEIVCTVKAHTLGYVGFGINPDKGSMDVADMIIGGVDDDGKTYFIDGHGEGHHFVEDESQDWKLLDAFESNGWTTLKFKRALRPCDQEEDVPITESTVRVIYSYGATDQAKHHHGNRGVQSLKLLNPNSKLGEDTSGFKSFNMSVKMELPEDRTTYWETIRCFPNLKSKVHIVGFERMVTTMEAQKYAYHMLVFHCAVPENRLHAATIQALSNTSGGTKLDPAIQSIRMYCTDPLFGWSVGGYPVFFPDDVGIPFGGPDKQECVLLEIHFNNPTNVKGLNLETGMTVYYSEELRKYGSSQIMIGTFALPHLIVPPGMNDFVHTGHCSSQCTHATFPQDGIKVIGGLLHTRIHGVKVRVRHFRGATELPWIMADDHYDFNYQQYNPIKEPVQVLPGDQLTTECFYDTISSDPPGATHEGLSSLQEMCSAFLFVYPAVPNVYYCVSAFWSSEEVLKPLGIGHVDSSDYINPTIMSPPEMKGLTLLDALNSKVNWTEDKINDLQDRMRWKNQTGFCLGNNYRSRAAGVSYPKNLTAYKPKFSCQNTSGEGPTTPLVASLLRLTILLVAWVGRIIIV